MGVRREKGGSWGEGRVEGGGRGQEGGKAKRGGGVTGEGVGVGGGNEAQGNYNTSWMREVVCREPGADSCPPPNSTPCTTKFGIFSNYMPHKLTTCSSHTHAHTQKYMFVCVRVCDEHVVSLCIYIFVIIYNYIKFRARPP